MRTPQQMVQERLRVQGEIQRAGIIRLSDWLGIDQLAGELAKRNVNIAIKSLGSEIWIDGKNSYLKKNRHVAKARLFSGVFRSVPPGR